MREALGTAFRAAYESQVSGTNGVDWTAAPADRTGSNCR